MGWTLVMFDLPVLTDKERKVASHFRKDLLDSGYLMIQWSIYARPCVTYEQMDTHIARVKSVTPEAGNVRLMFITDQQWGNAVTIVGPNYGEQTSPLLQKAEYKFSPNQAKKSCHWVTLKVTKGKRRDRSFER